MKDECQEAILYIVKAEGGETTSKTVLALLNETYPKREVKKHLRTLIDSGELEFGDDFELTLPGRKTDG